MRPGARGDAPRLPGFGPLGGKLVRRDLRFSNCRRFVLAPLDVGTRAPERRAAGRAGRRRALDLLCGSARGARRALIIRAVRSLLEPRRLPQSWSRTVFFRPSHNSPTLRWSPDSRSPRFTDHQSVVPPDRRSPPATPLAGNAADRARQLSRGRRRRAAAPSERRGQCRLRAW
jgi:hypothetical protein